VHFKKEVADVEIALKAIGLGGLRPSAGLPQNI
jgi:hypothetical protein